MTSELERARAAYAAAAKEADRLVRSNAPDWSKHKGRIDEAETAAALIAALEAEVSRLQGERDMLFLDFDAPITEADIEHVRELQAARQHDDGDG